jgi:hypothetical protein
MHYAKEFMADNPWYDSQGRDEDSAVVIAIDQSLSKDGFNPQTDDMEQRPHPADDIKQIYNYAGKGYKKREKQLNRLASHLDYEFIYMHLINSVPSLGEFVGYIDKFMISS